MAKEALDFIIALTPPILAVRNNAIIKRAGKRNLVASNEAAKVALLAKWHDAWLGMKLAADVAVIRLHSISGAH